MSDTHWPHPQEARRVGAAAHAVVARAKRTADDHGQLGHIRARDCANHLRAIFSDTSLLRLGANHIAWG